MSYINLQTLYGTTSFPERPRTHITGDRAVQIFNAACDPSWAIADLTPDDGLDLRLELTESEFVTGQGIFVQVRAALTGPTLLRSWSLRSTHTSPDYPQGSVRGADPATSFVPGGGSPMTAAYRKFPRH